MYTPGGVCFGFICQGTRAESLERFRVGFGRLERYRVYRTPTACLRSRFQRVDPFAADTNAFAAARRTYPQSTVRPV